jgi:hypothetical protein
MTDEWALLAGMEGHDLNCVCAGGQVLQLHYCASISEDTCALGLEGVMLTMCVYKSDLEANADLCRCSQINEQAVIVAAIADLHVDDWIVSAKNADNSSGKQKQSLCGGEHKNNCIARANGQTIFNDCHAVQRRK